MDTQRRPFQPHALMQKFYDLPIRRKTHLITLLIFISLGGIVGFGAIALIGSLHAQWTNQTKSQLAVTEINYNSGVEEMGLGFSNESEDPSVIAAAIAHAKGQALTPALQAQLKSQLKREIKIRNIEYATLVGKDLRIIANANTERRGEVFNPNQLVTEVFENPRQIRSSEVVSWSELSRESPSLPSGFSNQEALIRYTVTPIKAPGTRTVIGALVSGDIVNGKSSIVEKTVEAFQGIGYSAIYLRDSSGKFSLATSLEKTELRQSAFNLPLPNQSLLAAAVKAGGQPVSQRVNLGRHTYTLASKALPNSQGEAVAVLVYGDPEIALSQIIRNSWLVQAGLSVVVLGIVLVLTGTLGQAIVRPIKRLQQVTEEFSQGNYQARAGIVAQDEVGQLASNFNKMADNIETNDKRIRQETEMFRFLAQMTVPQNLDVSALDDLFNQALLEAQQLIKADRLLIYRFTPDWKGYIAYESVNKDWSSTLGEEIKDSCIPQAILEDYRQERVGILNNVSQAQLHPDHQRLLDRLQIKSNLVLPILNQGELFGLLIAHQCAYPRQWQETEINFLKQLITQLQVTLDRVSLRQKRQAESRLALLLKEITLKISRAFSAEALFNIAVQEGQQALQLDRVLVYRFDKNWKGTIIAESVVSSFPAALGATIADPCFADKYVEKYRQGRVQATPNIYAAGLTECHLKQLEPFGVKANLVVPILLSGELFGLLVAHQCSESRYWQQPDIDFFTQLALQVGVALERANLLEAQKIAEEEQRNAKETLQKRALELLMEVDPVGRGNLTIRAQVTNDEIGTIADSYNATIENLRQLVAQVKTATQHLTHTTSDNETAVQSLSLEAMRQAQEISQALEQLQEMTNSIQLVFANAEQALSTVQTANQTVETGEIAMNRTVEGMMVIRETVAETTKKVMHLGESSQKISKVVSLIGRFAAQTHLLALKASIESARAGEEGRGFAVIADEVRTLAAQSAEATAEIETLVVSIQLETKEVATMMETGTEQVSAGSKLLDDTRKRLNEITVASSQINDLVEAIALAALEQSQSSQTVTQTIAGIAAIAQNTSTSATHVSASFKELLSVTQELQSGIGQFKVQ